MAIGTLRDQVIYPDSADDKTQKGLSDDVLQQIMDVEAVLAFVNC